MLDINNAQDQLTDLVTELETAISTLVLASNIPLIGDHISSVTTAILAGLQEAKTKIEEVFETIPNDADVMAALAAAINEIEILGEADLIVATVNGAGDLDVRLAFEDDVSVSPGALSFGASTGLLGSFDATGSIALEAEAGFDINFTIDKDDGSIALDRDATEEEFTIGIKGEVDYDTTAKLGFLTVNIADNDATPDGTLDDIELDIALNLRSGAGNDPTVKVSGHATIDADITVEDNLLSILPGVEGALLVDLSYSDADLIGDAPADFGLDIQLKDVKLKIDGLVDLYNSIFGELDDIFDTFPIGQIVDLLTAKLPVISDIAPSSLDIYPTGNGDGKISLADVVVFLGQLTPGNSPALDFILAVIKVADAIKALETLGDALGDGEFSIGDINLAGNALDSIADGMGVPDGQNLVESGGSDLTALVDFINAVKGIAASDESDAAASSAPAPEAFAVPASATEVEPDDSIVKFPWLASTDALLESLASLMLNGFGAQPVTLIEFDIPELSFEISQRLPITFGVFYGFVEGLLEASIDINAGYDTAGFTNDGFAFAEGFYISPDLAPVGTGEFDDMGEELMKQPFGNMGLGLRAGGGVDVVLARVEIAGGLLGEINVFLGGTGVDDNKAYLAELGGCLINDIAGRIAVGLDLTISIGFGIFSISKTIGLAEITLAQFNIDPCANHGGAAIPEVDEAGLAFAVDSGVLILNVGNRANLRTIEDAVDQDFDGNGQAAGGPATNEVFSVTRVPPEEVEEGEPAPEPIDPFDQLAVQAFGVFERFDAAADFNLIQADGGSGNDSLSIEAGINIDVEFTGGDGKDKLTGGDGNDDLDGGNDKDLLFGNAGDDTLRGGDGNDVLDGGAGADLIDGQGGGADQVDYSGSNQGVTLAANPADTTESFGSGGDAEGDVVRNVEYFIGSRFDDTFYGNRSESNVFDAGNGDDVLVGGDAGDLFIGGKGADAMYGNQSGRANTPDDAASYVFSEGAVSINLETNTALGGEARGDTFFGIEDFQLTRFSDRFVGDDKANLIDAYDGDDFIDGGGGADSVLAGLGDDVVRGGLDGDVLDGGGFVNRLRDNDTLSYETSAIAVNASLFAGVALGIGGGGFDTIQRAQFLLTDADGKPVFQDIADDYGYRASTFENLRGSAQNDILTGDDQYNRIEGGDGADQIFGGAGFDTVIGGRGADALDGGQGIDTAEYKTSLLGVRADLVLGGTTGDASGDSYVSVENLVGSRLADILIGDAEDNVLDPYLNFSGGTAEQLIGRGGKDTAVLNFANGFDDVGKVVTLAANGTGSVTEAGNVTRATMNTIEQLRAFTGEGNDIVASQAAGDDVVNTHGGRDIILVGTGYDIVFAGADDDFVLRGNFITSQSTNVGAGADIDQSFYLDGGSGFDGLAIDLSFATQSLTLFGDGTGEITGGDTLSALGGSFVNFEALIGAFGGSGNDVLGQLGDVNSFFAGNGGADIVTTGFGFDTADGGESSRLLLSDESFLLFAEDVDILIVDYSAAEAGVMNTSYALTNIDAADVGRVTLVDAVFGDLAPTTLAATDFRNFERLFLTGTDRDDILIGMDQDGALADGDILIGGEGDDSIIGGAGNDILIGASRGGPNEELDVMTGGTGSDRFVMADGLGLIGGNVEDTVGITDFSDVQGDVIVLAGQAADYEIETQQFNFGDRPIYVSVISTITVGLVPGRPIAYVTSDHAPDLTSVQFEYVGPSPVGTFDIFPDFDTSFDAPISSFGAFQTLLDSSVTEEVELSLGLFRAGALDDDLAIEAVSHATKLASTTAIPAFDIDLNNPVALPQTITLALLAEGAPNITTADITFDAQTMIDDVIASFAVQAGEISDNAIYSLTSYDGNGAAAGTFSNMFGLDEGFVLSTGRVDEIIGENTADGQFNLAPESTIEVPLIFEDLGQVGGARTLYRALLPSVPGGIASLTLTDDSDFLGGATGRFSAFDLDAIKLSTTLIDSADVAGFEALESLNVFDFSPAGTVFTPGAQRPGSFAAADFIGSTNGFLDQGEARLDLGGGSTNTAADASGFISLGEGGSLGFNLTDNVSSGEDEPVYLYLVETGAPEILTGTVRVSSQPIDTVGDLSTDLGAPGLEGDTTKITSTFVVDFDSGKPDFEENTMIDFFDIVMVTEELPERGGILQPDLFRVLINGFDAIGDGEGGTVTMNTLAPTPFGDYADGLSLNLVADGPKVDEIRADAYTVVYRVSGPVIDGLNTIEIEVSDQKDAFLDTALFIAAAGESVDANAAPRARNDLLDVVEGDGGSVDLIAGIGFDTDDDGDVLNVTQVNLLNIDGTVRQTIDAGLVGFTTLVGENGSVRVSSDGVLEFETGSDFDALDTGEIQSVRFSYTLSDGMDVDEGIVTVRVIGEDDLPVNTSPDITSVVDFVVAENTVGPIDLMADDPEGDPLIWAISGGADAALFAIDANTGAVTFVAAPDFEAPNDVGADNQYELSVSVSDDGGLSDSADIMVAVTDVVEVEPLNPIIGTDGRDALSGTADDDIIWSKAGSYDRISGGAGADTFVFGPELSNGSRERDRITDFEAGVDSIGITTDDYAVRLSANYALITAGEDNDRIYVYGDNLGLEDLGLTLIAPDNSIFG